MKWFEAALHAVKNECVMFAVDAEGYVCAIVPSGSFGEELDNGEYDWWMWQPWFDGEPYNPEEMSSEFRQMDFKICPVGLEIFEYMPEVTTELYNGSTLEDAFRKLGI